MNTTDNRISDFIKSIEIKHNDIPHILILCAIIFGACLIGWVFWGITGLLTAAVISGAYIIISIFFHVLRATQTSLVYQQQKMQDYLTLFNNINFRAPLAYMTGFAATPELARVIYENVLEYKPELTVELGSGISSVITGYGLEKNGQGSLLSLDHNETYLKQTEQMLQKHKLSDIVQVAHCPICKQPVNQSIAKWYDLETITFKKPIDLLIIDGPPEQTQYKARYPAMPLLYKYLSDSAIIIMDDVKRPESRKTIQDWLEEYDDLKYQILDTEKGIGIFTRHPSIEN